MRTRALTFIFLALLIAAAAPAAAATAAAPTHHRLSVRIEPEDSQIEVVDRMTVRAGGPLQFRLSPKFTIREAHVNGSRVDLDAAANAFTVDLGEPGEHAVDVAYTAILAPAEASRAVLEPVIAPQASYLPPGSGWIPRFGDEEVTYHLTVRVPRPQKAVAPGRLLEDGLDGTDYRAVFVDKRPSTGPTVFAGPYVITERLSDGISLRTYFHPQVADYADLYLTRSAAYLARFSADIGAYPYEDFHIVTAPYPVGFGFPNLTYIATRIVALPFMQGRSLAHEVAHNWWGNAVGVDYESGNWAEGLTTYMADYALAAEEGPEAQREMRLAWLRDFAALPSEQDFPLTQFTSRHGDSSQVVGYNKAAFVFHMLERRIGEAAFSRAIKGFWSRHKFTTASWKDLQASFQRATDTDLSGFFRQWIDRAGAPRIELVSASSAPVGDRFTVSAAVRMTTEDYTLDVPIVIETEGGPETRTLSLAEDGGRGEWLVDGRPVSIAVDPDHHVFRKLLLEEAPPILRDLTLNAATLTAVIGEDPDTVAAARELAKRLLGNSLRFAGADAAAAQMMPLVIIGRSDEVNDALADLGLPPAPFEVAGKGTARLWTGRFANGRAYAVIAAEDTEALSALARRLPHYGRMSYLTFDGAKVVEKGVWKPATRPLRKSLAPA